MTKYLFVLKHLMIMLKRVDMKSAELFLLKEVAMLRMLSLLFSNFAEVD